MKKTITVTAKDIQKAAKLIAADGMRTQCCPIALAARRVFRKPVRVSYEAIAVADHKYFYLPSQAAKFIDNFDNGLDVEPFSFEVAAH